MAIDDLARRSDDLERIEIAAAAGGDLPALRLRLPRLRARLAAAAAVAAGVRARRSTTMSALQDRVLHDPAVMERLLLDLSINVTAMFRDPTFYRAFREKVVPLLRTYPFIRIWHAGCSTGEEVYSLAILLRRRGSTSGRASTRPTSTRRCCSGPAPASSRSSRCGSTRENYLRAGGTRVVLELLHGRRRHGARFDPELIEQRRLRPAQPRLGRLVQRVQRDRLPQRDDLLRQDAAGPRARALLRQPRAASACSPSATRSRSGSRATRTATRRSTRRRSSTGRCA